MNFPFQRTACEREEGIERRRKARVKALGECVAPSPDFDGSHFIREPLYNLLYIISNRLVVHSSVFATGRDGSLMKWLTQRTQTTKQQVRWFGSLNWVSVLSCTHLNTVHVYFSMCWTLPVSRAHNALKWRSSEPLRITHRAAIRLLSTPINSLQRH